MKEERVRCVRTLVYEGTRTWVENTLARSYVQGEQIVSQKDKVPVFKITETRGEIEVIQEKSE